MRMKFYFIFLFSLLATISFGQAITPAPGYNTVCPGQETYFYSVDPGPDYSDCGTFTWTVSNGSFNYGTTVTTTTTASATETVTVYWKDVTNKGKLTVTSPCHEGTLSTNSDYTIRSLKSVDPTNLRTLQSIPPYCNVATINLSVDEIKVPNTGFGTSIPQQYADGYEWTLPTGWSFVGSSNSNFITVQTASGCTDGGTFSVRGYINSCGLTKFYSNSASITLNRPSASITVTPPSGYTGSSWCNQNGVTFTATPIGCFSKYEWYFPSGWTGPNGELTPYPVTSGNTVTLKPSGDAADAGAITVKVYLDCGKVLTSSPYTVTYTPPTTYVSGSALVCSGNTTYSVANAPSGITTSWSSSNSSLLSINSSTGVATRQGTGNGSVIVTANVQGCRSMSVSRTVWVGKPKINSITAPDAMMSGQSDLFINSSSGGSSYSWLVPSGWTVQSPNNFSTWITVGSTTSGTYNVYATTGNTCGSTTGSTPVTVTGGGGGCSGAMSLSPNPATNEVVVNAAPPPCFTATETQSATSFSLSSDDDSSTQSGSVVVTDHMGVIHRQMIVEGTDFSIDVNGLKPGIYIVKYTTNGYTTESRLVKH